MPGAREVFLEAWTDAERGISELLTHGLTVEEIAVRRKTKPGTVKKQIKHAARKIPSARW